MSDDRRLSFEAALEAWVEQRASSGGGGEHPAPELLERLKAGTLEPETAEALRDHLAVCRDCVARWRSPEPFARAEQASEFETAAFWRSLRPRLAEIDAEIGAESEAEPVAVRTTAAASPVSTTPRWQALAAVLLAGVIGLSFWVARQRSVLEGQAARLAELGQPQANTAIVDLTAGAARGEGSRAVEIAADRGAVLVLTPSVEITDGAHELSFLGEGGRVVLTVSALRPDLGDGSFALWLPAGALPPGPFEVRLERLDGASRHLVERFAVDVVPSRAR